MTVLSAFKSSEGEAAYFCAYSAAMKMWPVPYDIDAEERSTQKLIVVGECRLGPEELIQLRLEVTAAFRNAIGVTPTVVVLEAGLSVQRRERSIVVARPAHLSGLVLDPLENITPGSRLSRNRLHSSQTWPV